MENKIIKFKSTFADLGNNDIHKKNIEIAEKICRNKIIAEKYLIIFQYNEGNYKFTWLKEELSGITKELAWDLEAEINKTISDIQQ